MCVALVIRGKATPTLAQFEAMERANSDGAGLAWVENHTVRFRKGLKAKEVHKLALEAPRPVMIHFRFATAGGNSAGLCHPFPIKQDAPIHTEGTASSVMMHNGHWSEWEEYVKIVAPDAPEGKLPEGPWSDTRFAAYLMANYPKQLDTITSLVGGRVAVMNWKGKIRQWGSWVTLPSLPGVSFSNTYWQAYASSWSYTGNYSHSDWKSGWKSQTCQTREKSDTEVKLGSGGSCEMKRPDYPSWEEYYKQRYGMDFSEEEKTQPQDEKEWRRTWDFPPTEVEEAVTVTNVKVDVEDL